MIETDLRAGLTMHFDSALPRGTGVTGVGEFSCSSQISGSLLATPRDDWDDLKKVLPLMDPPIPVVKKPFSTAYVPYVDGRIHYHQGADAVLSGEYSGCLMAVYNAGGQRRVAHVPKSNVIRNDTIAEFRDYFANHTRLTDPKKTQQVKGTHTLTHFFQPFVESRDSSIQFEIIGKLMGKGMISQPYQFSVFGLVTVANKCVSIWAVKPNKQPSVGEMWHVVAVRVRAPQVNFFGFENKTNHAALDVLPE